MDEWWGTDYQGDWGGSDPSYAEIPYDSYMSYGSIDPSAYAFDSLAPDPMAGITGVGAMGGYTDPETGQVYNSGGIAGGGLAAPGAAAPGLGMGLGGLGTLQGILGLGGGLAGLIGTLAGGGTK